MADVVNQVKSHMTSSAAKMAARVDPHRRNVDITVGSMVWLSTKNLRLPPTLSRKLAMRWTGPFKVVAQINPVAFQLEMPARWRIHDVFHTSCLKVADASSARQLHFEPGPDESGEFEVEDILDSRDILTGRRHSREYLVKWLGYSLQHASWEPASNLTNCPDVLANYLQRRGLR